MEVISSISTAESQTSLGGSTVKYPDATSLHFEILTTTMADASDARGDSFYLCIPKEHVCLPWEDDEIRARINVWSESAIQEQLHGAIRNVKV